MFDVTKCGEIFYFLVADGQIVILKGPKTPSLEKREKNIL